MILIRGFLVKVLMLLFIAVLATTSFGYLSLNKGFKIASNTSKIGEIYAEHIVKGDILEFSYCEDILKKDTYVLTLDTKNKLYKQTVTSKELGDIQGSIIIGSTLTKKTSALGPWWLYIVLLVVILIWPMPRRNNRR